MKINPSSRGLSYFSKQRIHGRQPVNILEMLRRDSESGSSKKGVLENILRWEDDGCKIIEINHATLDQKKEKTNE
jgi:hypothetical protein